MRYQRTISKENNSLDCETGDSNPFLDSLNAGAGEALPDPVEPINTTEEVDVSLAEDTSDTPEAIEASVLSASADVVAVAERVGDITDTVVGLENIALQLQKIRAAEGTVSAESYGFLTIAYNQTVRKFPALQKTNNLPSMEDFAMNSQRASTVSLESVVSKIQAGYEAVVKFIKDLIERVKAFFGHILSGGAVIDKKARSLKERLKTVNDNAKGKDITLPAVLCNPVLTKAAIEGLGKAVGSIGTVSYRDLMAIYERAKKQESVVVAEVLESFHKVFDAYGKLAGDVYLGNLSFNNDDFPPVIKLLEASTRQVKPFTKSTMNDYLDENIRLAGVITQLKSNQEERVKALTVMMASIKHHANQHNEDDTRSKTRKHLEVVQAAVQFLRKLTVFENKLLSRTIQVGNAINNAVAASIGSLEAYDK